jgi:transporter family-2 protein
MNLLPISLAVLGGALLPAQFAINAALSNEVRSLTLTGAISYLGGTLVLLLVLIAFRARPNWAAAKGGPRWMWLGGVVGSAYVVGSALLTRTLGAAVATTLVIASQILTAVALDHVGGLGLAQRRLNPTRLAAVVLALAALAVRLWGAR